MEGNGYNPMKREIEMLIEENKKLKKKVEEAEGENTIIKGIGNNSPEMKTLKDQVNSLTAQLKEKDLMIEQEVVYKMEERKKWEGLSNEIHKIKKQLGFYIAFNKNGKEKIFELIKEVIKFYGEKLEEKKHH
jgi:chromosome condensin MukBEF ATPase and DNA-binding subunit MukB